MLSVIASEENHTCSERSYSFDLIWRNIKTLVIEVNVHTHFMFITVFTPAYRKQYTIHLCFILKCTLNVFIKYWVCFGMDNTDWEHSYICVCVCVCSKGACNLTKQYVAISNKCFCFYSANQILSSTMVFNILYLWSNTCSFGEHEMAYKYTKYIQLFMKKTFTLKNKGFLLALIVPWRIFDIHRTVLFIIFSGNRFLRFFLMFFTLRKQWFFLRTVRWKIL